MSDAPTPLPRPAELFDLGGRRALVTGSSRGIGLALARYLAGAGAHVILHGRDTAVLAAERDRLAQLGAPASAAAFDVTIADAVRDAVGRLEAEGPIDILVNNVGIQRRHPFVEFPESEWLDVLETNLNACFRVSQAVARGMVARRRGKIISVLSLQAELARPGISAYAASKGGLQMLTRSLCVELARHNIQANAIAPGYFETELTAPLVADRAFSDWLCARTPAGRWGAPEELGGAVVFLASGAADFVNGHTLFVDGGMRATV